MIDEYLAFNEQEIRDKELIEKIYNKMDNIYSRENEIAHYTSSAWIVNKDRTKVLMIYHNIYDSWAWTGGHADEEKDLLKVAIKEAKEETGLKNVIPVTNKVFSLEILPVAAHVKRKKHVSTHLHINTTFLLEADESEHLRIKEDENKAVAWFLLDDAIKASTEPHMQIIYKKLNEKLKSI